MPGEGTKPKTERVKDQKGKTDSKGKEDYSLPPSAHVLERDRKSSTPKKSPEPKEISNKNKLIFLNTLTFMNIHQSRLR